MNKRVIITATTGRSGTGYLYTLGNLLPDVHSEHEPEPMMARQFRPVLYGTKDGKELWNRKFDIISRFIEPTYLETSHLTCKGFIEPLLELDITPDLIILKRNHRQIATSFFKLGTIPARSPLGIAYCLQPDDPHIHYRVENWKTLNDYQLCYWQCLEMDQRQQYYHNKILSLGGQTFSTSVTELKNTSHFKIWCNFMNTEVTPSLLAQYEFLKQKRVNTQESGKRKAFPFTDAELDRMELEVRNRKIND